MSDFKTVPLGNLSPLGESLANLFSQSPAAVVVLGIAMTFLMAWLVAQLFD